MLLIERIMTRRRAGDDAGMALVLVVLVMLVGMVATGAIAAGVFFAINGNVANKRDTQAFIAAESGRDQVRATLTAHTASNTCSASTMAAVTLGSAAGPYFNAEAQSISVPAGGAAPTDWDDTVVPACPTIDTDFIVIRSTGYGTNDVTGSNTTILSVYEWQVVPQNAQGGTMAGTNGSFHGVGGGSSSSNISGDLVVRKNDYTCSGSSYIDGDLWVLGGENGATGGNVTITGGCEITGSIYAAGTVSSNGGNNASPIVIGKSILARGGISMDSNGVSVGLGCAAADGATCGQVASGVSVNLTSTGGTGVVAGTVTAPAAPSISANWERPDHSPLAGSVGAAPTFNPPLNSSQNGGSTAGTVYAMTEWLEFSASTDWLGTPAVATRIVCPSDPNSALSNATGPVVLDYTGGSCSATTGNTTNINLSGGNVPHDAVFLVAPGKTMDVRIAGNLTAPASPGSQIFFVHQSLNTGDVATDCGRPTGDNFKIISGTISPRVMVYTPCGLNGTWTGALTGQLYVGGSMTYNGSFTCEQMAWAPTPSPMPEMDCRILGAGGAAGGTTYSQSLGGLVSQEET